MAYFALDMLLAQHTPIDRVCAVHLAESDARIERSLDHLAQHLHSDYPQPIYLERVPVREWLPQPDGGIGPGRVIAGVEDRATSEAIRMTLHQLFNRLKGEGGAIELCKLARGPTNAQTAIALHLSVHTMASHKQIILAL